MKKLILLLIFPIMLFSSSNILTNSEVYIDKNSTFKISNINEANFKSFDSLGTKKINLGYVSDTVWLKFSLSNPTDKPIKKVLVLDNQMLDSIMLFSKQKNGYKKEVLGVLHHRDFTENIIDFHFDISLEANETKEFYLKVSSLSCAVYFKLALMDKSELLKNEFDHQMILVIFFTAMLTLVLYNIFIYVFTKEITYVYYVMYLVFTVLNHASYSAISLHLLDYLPSSFVDIDAYLAIFYLSFIGIFALLFTRSFLNIKKYKKIDVLFKIMIILPIILVAISSSEFYPIDIVSLILLLSLASMIVVSYYLFYKKESNAKFFIVGWTIALIGSIMLGTYQIGVFSLIVDYPYFYEITIFSEAVLFAIALSSRLNKTKELEQQVNKNKVLTKELHHRVKNNMQFIISLYRLKLNENINNQVNEKLNDVENSIKAMSNIHEILYEREDIENINTNEYFQTLIAEIENTYRTQNISISLNCNSNLDIQKAIYCGIILNELVTNSFKYAFMNNEGNIFISLETVSNKNILIIEDDGVGYDTYKPTTGFGLELVNSLVSNELKGNIEIDSSSKMKYSIVF